MTRKSLLHFLIAVGFLLGLQGVSAVWARDAAFMDPGAMSGGGRGASDEAITPEPKSEVNVGDTVVNIARRATLFFANNSNMPVDVVSVAVEGDGNVKAEIVGDDCSKEGKIAAGNRCAVAVELTPTANGTWMAEVLVTHKGAGRLARAKVIGKATGQLAGDKRESGLSLSTKEIKPVDFGTVDAESGKAVRSALMINDSVETITILSIDVIAAENGLERLEQGCAIDMELKPGESCPVTLVWKPTAKGLVSTDLIIRHTGKLGFAVIPIRGTAQGRLSSDGKAGADGGKESDGKNSGKGLPPPALSDDFEKAIGGAIQPVTTDQLTGGGAKAASGGGALRINGTGGNLAVLLKPDGATVVAGIGEEITYADGKIAKVTNVMPKQTEIFVEGKKKTLPLEAASEITSKATSARSKEMSTDTGKDAKSGGASSSSSKGNKGKL